MARPRPRPAEIKRLTNRRGVHVVIEHVGEATWPMSVRSLARRGRVVAGGATTGYHGSLAAQFGKIVLAVQ